MHSTSNLIDGNFDDPGLLHNKQKTDSTEHKDEKYKEKSSPGPSRINTVESAQYSLDDHNNDFNDDPTPRPNEYRLDTSNRIVYLSAPAYTMASRRKDIHYENYRSPGPVYDLPSISLFKPRAPGYSFGIRHSWRKVRV